MAMAVAASSLCGDGVVSGRAAAGKASTIARIGRRSARFGCSASDSEVESSSYSTSCRMQRRTITCSSGRGSARQGALRSRKHSDVVVGGAGADAMRGEDDEGAMGSFWDRLQLAWRVLIGAPNEAQATKKRFSRLLVRDRGFNSANLSRLYNAAKGAIQEHVELEIDEDTEVAAVVDRLGELRLDFRVKRVKSVLRDEPFSDSVLPEMEPSLSTGGDHLWKDGRAPHDSEVRLGVALDERLPNSALPISGDQVWGYSRAPLDLKARLGVALDGAFPNYMAPDGESLVSTSGGHLWKDSRASHDLEVAGGAYNLKSTTVGEALGYPLPKPVLPDEEPNLSISGDQLWKDGWASQGMDDQVGGPSNLRSSAAARVLNEPSPNSSLPDSKSIISITGDQLSEESRTAQDVEEASYLPSTMDVDSEGVWYTFSFTNSNVGQGLGATIVDGGVDKQP